MSAILQPSIYMKKVELFHDDAMPKEKSINKY